MNVIKYLQGLGTVRRKFKKIVRVDPKRGMASSLMKIEEEHTRKKITS